MRSRRSPWRWLLAKEWRELIASRSWWVMLVLIGPLVGVSFISAVRTYAEASGLNGTAAGVGEAFSPLIGVWAPTFSACELAAAFLLPFVGIRLVSGDRQSGAIKIELQQRLPAMARISAKALVLLAGWSIATPGASAGDRAVARIRRNDLSAGARRGAARPPAQRRAERRPGGRDRVGHGPSVDGRDPDAERHGGHLDHQLHRRRAGRVVGADRRLHADRDGRGVPARPDASRHGADRAGA